MTTVPSIQWRGALSTTTTMKWGGRDGGGAVTIEVPMTELRAFMELCELQNDPDEIHVTVIRQRDLLAMPDAGPLPFDERDDDVTLGVDGGEVGAADDDGAVRSGR